MREETPEFDELIDCYLAGRLTEPEAGRLLDLLQRHPDLGAELLDQMSLDTMLRDLVGQRARPALVPDAPAPTSRPGRFRRFLPWTIASGFGLGAAAALLVIWIWPLTTGPAASAEEPTTTAVAVLTRAVEVRWAEPAEGVRVGSPLAPGWLRLDGGVVEIEFFSGVRVILEGPAQFRLLSPTAGYCQAGRLTAEAPPHAQGFRIGTPQRDVVDRGTTFGLEVSQARAEVHVFRGKVELHGREAASLDLTTGQAVALTEGEPDRRLPANPAGFVTRADLDRRQDQEVRRWSERWQKAGQGWNADPALLVRYNFEPGDSPGRALPNRATKEGEAGTVVGCSWAEGRWPGKHALEFGGVGDRVRLHVPGEHRSLTLAAWVRVHGLDRKFNSLLMADAFDPGAVHWQVLSDGRVRLGVSGPGPRRLANYDSPRVFTPDRLGQWVHLAVVYDADTRRVSHYVDGLPVRREELKFTITLRLGPAELGNWNPAARADAVPIRHFSGRIDEFALFARPLSDAEIRRCAE